jgi:beta-phosphoglucomutase-like phosphatase (HAD superfamily)
MVVSAEDTEACKPHPEGYLKAVALFNLYLAEQGRRMEPGQCVVIEDSIAGVQSAKAAGMKCVAITHSYQADELAEADRIIDKMADFTPQLVQELMGA